METPKANISPFEQQWLLLNAIRQVFGIAERSIPTYERAAYLSVDLAPDLLSSDSELAQAYQSETVRLYTERAFARSETALQLLDSEIAQLRSEYDKTKPEQRRAIEQQINKLLRARGVLDDTGWTETQAINRDADVPEKDLPISDKGQGYKEYRLDNDRRLRVRVLHPDPAEGRSGIDVIYETYQDKVIINEQPFKDRVRIAALQYKMWDGSALYLSQAKNLEEQIEKMRRVLCQSGLCSNDSKNATDYRLPYCCAFLRPTDVIQTRRAWQTTRAWHVPICVAEKNFQQTKAGNKVLRASRVYPYALTQSSFLELYNHMMIGSHWMAEETLQDIYRQIGIFDKPDNITIHAQEYPRPRPASRRRARVS